MKGCFGKKGIAAAVIICMAALWGCGDASKDEGVLEVVGGIEYTLPGGWDSSTIVGGCEASSICG